MIKKGLRRYKIAQKKVNDVWYIHKKSIKIIKWFQKGQK